MQTYDSHKSVTEVRQASRTKDNLWVLIVSFGAVVVIFAVIFTVYFAMTPPAAILP
jgi:hypothetical protein